VADEDVTEDVRQLLRDHVEVYEELETLLLLHGRRDRIWDVDAVADALKIPTANAAAALERLRGCGLAEHVAVEGVEAGGRRTGFRLSARRPGLADTVARLAACYEDQRHVIIRLMNANAIERIRTSAMRAFADSFVVGKKKDG
jgi:hypothetical protein